MQLAVISVSTGGGTARAQPFYCPFCSEEDFVPFGEEPGRYLCNSCNRHYSVKFIGLGRPPVEEPEATSEAE